MKRIYRITSSQHDSSQRDIDKVPCLTTQVHIALEGLAKAVRSGKLKLHQKGSSKATFIHKCVIM